MNKFNVYLLGDTNENMIVKNFPDAKIHMIDSGNKFSENRDFGYAFVGFPDEDYFTIYTDHEPNYRYCLGCCRNSNPDMSYRQYEVIATLEGYDWVGFEGA